MPCHGAKETRVPRRATRSPPHRALESSAWVDAVPERHDVLQRERLRNHIGKRSGRETHGLYHRVFARSEFTRGSSILEFGHAGNGLTRSGGYRKGPLATWTARAS